MRDGSTALSRCSRSRSASRITSRRSCRGELMTGIFGDFRRLVIAALDGLVADGALPKGLDFSRVAVEPPRDPSHGDLATNAAMILAGPLKQNPMAMAERIAAALAGRELQTAGYRGCGFQVEVARPGFLNIRLEPGIWHAQLR